MNVKELAHAFWVYMEAGMDTPEQVERALIIEGYGDAGAAEVRALLERDEGEKKTTARGPKGGRG